MSQYYNPQQEPGSERRLLLVFALTFIILLIFQPLLTRYLRKDAPPAEPSQQQQAQQAPPAPAKSIPPAPVVARPTPSRPQGALVKQAETESEIVIENDLYRITFTNRGGQVKSWILKNYKDDHGRPLDLVNRATAEQHGYPLSLWTYDQDLRNKLNSALYVAAPGGKQRAPAEITFEYADDQIRVRKTFHFDHSYVLKVETSVEQDGQMARAYPAWPAGFGDQFTPASYASSRLEWQYGEEVERLDLKKISGGNTLPGPFQWLGVADQYFAAVFLPADPAAVNAVTLRHALQVPRDPQNPQGEKITVEVLGAAAGNPQGPTSERIFVGPKALDVVEAVQATPLPGQAEAPNLGPLVDFGFFGIIARPLFLWLRWTYHNMVPNWGVAIIILTVVINIVLFPLRLSSMKSAMKMQKIQPQVNAIKDKYKKYSLRDPRKQEMNQEVAALFKREGVNPAGGCLPLIIQMPFLFAFYSMLASAIELRHASFLWVSDLSSPDPWHVLPIAIAFSTWGMQKMTPAAGMDPAQQKIMTVMMPVMLGFISWSLSAGLGVYWVIGNLIAILQQVILNRTRFGKEMRAAAEKRARQRLKTTGTKA